MDTESPKNSECLLSSWIMIKKIESHLRIKKAVTTWY